MNKKILITITFHLVLICILGFLFFQFQTVICRNNQVLDSQAMVQKNIRVHEKISKSDLEAELIVWTDEAGIAYSQVSMLQSGVKRIIDLESSFEITGASFSNLRFSPNQQFILFNRNIWEATTTELYDLTTNNVISLSDLVNKNYSVFSQTNYEFVGNNEDYLISCSVDGLATHRYFSVIKLKPEIKSIYYTEDLDLSNGYNESAMKCFYDKTTQQAILEYNGKLITNYPLPI